MLLELIVRFMELLAEIPSKQDWVIQKIEEWQDMPKGSDRYQAAMQLQAVLAKLKKLPICRDCGKCIYKRHYICEARLMTLEERKQKFKFAMEQPPLALNPDYDITWAVWAGILEAFTQELDL